jgi:hypothetical protein
MNPREISVGQKFGRWLIIGPGTKPNGHTGAGPWFLCRCDCGCERSVWGHSLVAKHASTSCGCYQRERCAEKNRRIFTKHGHNRSRKNGHKTSKEYRAWWGMISRCIYRSNQNYARYGGRGISVCDQWRHSFETFLSDVGPAPTPEHSLDRINCAGNYEPTNVRWATITEQTRNTRCTRLITYDGRSLIAGDWAKLTGVKRTTIASRLSRGWPVEQALTVPARITKRTYH